MAKASLISTLIDDHSVFHIVTCVGNDSNDSICTVRILSEIVLIVTLSANKRLLGEKNSINFVVHAERMIVVRGSHSLLRHLALIHITRGLIVFREGLHCCNYTQYVDGVKLLMSSIASNIFF